MDWGKGIVLVLITFGILMGTLVTICVRQDDLHLVVQNYYEEEVKYQEHIDRVINTHLLEHEILVFDSQLKIVDLHLPVGAKGTLHFFRPSDARLDKKMEVNITDSNANSIDVKELKAGYWKVKLTWSESGKDYYQEKNITI